MPTRRLLITGASGSGTTTLGRALASRWHVPHADLDDYFWLPTVPPFTAKRPEADRVRLMGEVFLPRASWVASGSPMGWGDGVIPLLDAAVLLTLDPGVRERRITEREVVRLGDELAPGRPGEAEFHAFLEWARGYDDPEFDGRSLVRHERWLAALSCPVLRLDSAAPVEELADAVDELLAR
ncbi:MULTISPECIES: hypothetical protein [Actinosynnema]|uniref:hypothetical protein n=1 Tax=Actinosynnema TaxID=40566 RepID=UPI0020A4BB9F|nr:hypothetical protein [Actinosynnema pretiosum]MCP2096341.1 adenylate kinase [Actinosynnema pretiosum]